MPGPIVFRTAATGGPYARSRLNRFAVAVAITAVGALVRWALTPVIAPTVRWFVFFPVVLFATLYGRFAAGLIAICLSILLASIFWTPSFSIQNTTSIIGFATSASLIAWAIELSLRARRDLELERQFLNIVLGATSDRLAVLSADWRCVFVDPAVAEVTGKSSTDLIGRTIWDIFPQLQEPRFAHELHRCHRDRVPVHFEIYSPHDNRWLLFRAHPLDDESVILYVADISARKHEQRDKDQAREEAANLERLVGERTASLRESVAELELTSYAISHNLRAPLRTMEAFASFLLVDYADKLDATGRDYLNRINTSAQRMDKLIEAVLAYSRVSRSEIPMAPVNLDRLLDAIVTEYAGPEEVTISHPLGTVNANEVLLSQAVSNLVDNAAKFVRPGTRPQITISTEQGGGTIRLIVRDQGIGLPSGAGDRIFTSFERAHEDYPGLGIGLPIVKRAVERMGGHVGFESEMDHGSSFWIELPKVKAPQNEPSQLASPAESTTTVQE